MFSFLLPSKELSDLMAETGDLMRYAKPNQGTVTLLGQTKPRRHADCCSSRKIPGQHWRNVLRCALERDVPPFAQPAVKLNAGRKVLAAKCTGIGAGSQCQWPARAERIPEFPNAFVN